MGDIDYACPFCGGRDLSFSFEVTHSVLTEDGEFIGVSNRGHNGTPFYVTCRNPECDATLFDDDPIEDPKLEAALDDAWSLVRKFDPDLIDGSM